MPRNRQLTQKRIQEAALALLHREGFEAWGVNRIAREAGIDKVLLYRYFGSLEGLLQKIVDETSFWPVPDDLPDHSAEAFISATLQYQTEQPGTWALLAHPIAREPFSPIRRKFSSQLEEWIGGFKNRTRGYITADALESLPALIHLKSSTGLPSDSAHQIWKRFSPPLVWGASLDGIMDEELPTELL